MSQADALRLIAEAEPMEIEPRRVAPIPAREERWPVLAEAALHGLAGRIVRTIEPHTEADSVAILVQALVAIGSLFGHGPHHLAEADRHGASLFAVLVGKTSKGRKGSSWGHIRRLVEEVCRNGPPVGPSPLKSGLSTGEGLIWAVRDAIVEQRSDGEEQIREEGVADKRLLVIEGEFARVLRVANRDGNILSNILRLVWDVAPLEILTRTDPVTATDAHIAILGHITADELLRRMGESEAANGYANRFLWALVRRSKYLPDGGALRDEDRMALVVEVHDVVIWALGLGDFRLRRDERARELWHEIYPRLSDGRPGLLGAVTGRAEAQALRLSVLYALLDRSKVIREEHLQAALAVWSYCADSAEIIFGDATGDPIADELLAELRRRTDGMTRTDVQGMAGRHVPAARLNRAIEDLVATGRIRVEERRTGGRPATVYHLAGGQA